MRNATTGRARGPDVTRVFLATPDGLPAGTVVADRYRVIGVAGVGANGIVYRALDERLRVEIALKVLRPEKVPDSNVLERFEQELVLARQVTHPNVVRIHDIGQDGELHFLTMDLVEGRSLRQILDERGRLAVREAVIIARDLAEALAAAHRQSVVHRDLKPANVLVDAEGRACVTDFGVARSMVRSGPTRRGNIVGTLDYLAPEQARCGEVDGRTDIYALGLILFEMLSGQPAFRGESPGELIAARSLGRRLRLSQTGVSVPRWLRRVVNHCLEVDPERRYQSAVALAADLGAGRSSGRQVPRGPLLAGAAAIAAVAVAGWWYSGHSPAVAAKTTVPAVAVLPFAVRSGDAKDAWLSTALAEMLGQALGESADLRVADSLRVLRTIESQSGEPARDAQAGRRQLGELLDAERLITGEIEERGGGVRIALQVSGGGQDAPVRVLHADGALSALPALSEQLADELLRTLGAAPAPTAPSPFSSDAAALASYSRGLELMAKGETVAAGTAFEEAVVADSTFAAAWLRLAAAYRALGYDDRALTTVRKAIAELPEPSGRLRDEALALEAALEGNAEQSRQRLTLQIERHPRDVEARVKLAELYGDQGQPGRAQQELQAVVAESPNHPRAWYLLGKFAIEAGSHHVAAEQYLGRSLKIQQRLGSIEGMADTENALGVAFFELNDLEQARKHYRSAIELRQQIGDERGVAAVTANVARLLLADGQFDAARAGFEESLSVAERAGDNRSAAALLTEIGAIEERQGRYRDALERYRRSLSMLQVLGNPLAMADGYNHVGLAYYQLGDFGNAALYTNLAVELYSKAKSPQGQLRAGQAVALLALARGEWDAAEKALLDMLRLGRALEDPLAQARALGDLGRVAQWQGNYGAALASILEGLAALEPAGDPNARIELYLRQADLAFELGMLNGGREALAKAQPLLDQSGSAEQRIEWWRLSGVGHLRAGQIEEARRAFDSARAQASLGSSAMSRLAIELGAAETALAGGERRSALATLTQLHANAQALGHLPLVLESGELLARAQAEAGRLAAAERQLRACLTTADARSPWAGSYRLHGQLAGLMQKRGRESEADVQLRAATDEVERLRKGLDASQRAAFEQLDGVRQLS